MEDRRAAAVLLAYTLLFFMSAALGGGQFYFRDVSQNHLPLRMLEAEQMAGGALPVWNPNLSFGQPALANPNYLTLQPSTLLYTFLPFDMAFRWGVLLHYVLAGLATFGLLRALRCGRPAAWLGAVAFAFGGPLVSLGNLQNVLMAVAWLPLAVFLARRAILGGGVHWILAAAAALAISVVGGEPLNLAAVLVFTVVFTWWSDDTVREGARLRRQGARFAGVIGLGALLASVQIFPAMELLRGSERGGGFDLALATRWSVHPWRLVELVVPGWFGNPTSMTPTSWWGERFFDTSLPFLLGIYVGAPVLLLAAAGACQVRRRRLPRALLVVAGGALLLALGKHLGLFSLLHEWLPGFDTLRYPSKFLVAFSFAVAGLAACGLDGLVRGEGISSRPRALLVTGGALAGALAGLGLLLIAVPAAGDWLLYGAMRAGGAPGDGRAADVLPQLARSCGYAALVAAVATGLGGARALGRLRPGVAAWGLVALVAVDLYAGNGRLNPTVDPAWYRVEPRFLGTIREIDPQGRIYRESRPPDFGLRLRGGAGAASTGFLWDRLSLRNATGLQYALHFAYDRNNDRLNPGPSARAARLLPGMSLEEKLRLWRLGATRFVVSYQPLDVPGVRLIDAVRGESNYPLLLYEVTDTLPRARVVGRAEPAFDLDAVLQRVRSPEFDPAGTVLLPPTAGPARGEARSAPALVTEAGPERLEIRTAAEFDGWLVLSDTHFPGWRAEVDGEPMPIEPAYGMFRAVAVPAGEHRVAFHYEPRALQLGGLLSSVSLVAALALVAVDRRRRPAA